jgi:hypothetical protein
MLVLIKDWNGPVQDRAKRLLKDLTPELDREPYRTSFQLARRVWWDSEQELFRFDFNG